MNKQTRSSWSATLGTHLQHAFSFFQIFTAFFLIEVLAFYLLKPDTLTGLIFGLLWAAMLSFFILCLPKLAARITFGISYFVMLLWTLAQAGYYQFFGKLMWVSTVSYAGEGADYLKDVISFFPALWWVGLVTMVAFGIFLVWKFPRVCKGLLPRAIFIALSITMVIGLCILPKSVVSLDKGTPGTDSAHKHASNQKAYDTMFDAKRVYDITGIYQLTFRDIWVNEIYPLTSHYNEKITQQKRTIAAYFANRGTPSDNSMTGIFAGKNVIMVLMESLDDWMITEEETPTIKQMMDTGIQFTNLYTPGYGSARTLNSEFCINTGIYLPTTGADIYDYMDNSFPQTIASQLSDLGYTGHVFHYNNPNFYSRGILEPAIGYDSYVAYSDYVEDRKLLCQDTLLFDLPEVRALFFREGPSFNTIITRSAHLGYTFREIIAYYAVQDYPEYRYKYDSEEESCARLKAMLIDKMFERLLEELRLNGQLENTVIIAISDHYTYGYENTDELFKLSGVNNELLLEKTPCFVWSVDCPTSQVAKTLNTSDFLPTMLNLLGIDSPYSYLGQDAFDPNYKGYAFFPDGSWISDGVAYQNGKIIMNESGREVSTDEIAWMTKESEEYRNISNLLLTSNYYQ